MITQYLSDIINGHKGKWKIQQSTRINFVPSINSQDSEDSKNVEDSKDFKILIELMLCTNSDNIVIMIVYETDEITENAFNML